MTPGHDRMVDDGYPGFSGFSNRRKAHTREMTQTMTVQPNKRLKAPIRAPLGWPRTAATTNGMKYATTATKTRKSENPSVTSMLPGRGTFVAGLQARLDQAADGFGAKSNAVCE